MTKCIVLGKNEPKENKKVIEFTHYFDPDDINKFIKSNNLSEPYMWSNIELISSNYRASGNDLIFAYNDNRSDSTLYLGHWNNGIV